MLLLCLSKEAKLSGDLSEVYNVRETYERAQRRSDPLLAPHGFFRGLAPGNNLHARDFLERFGPLRLTPEQQYSPVIVPIRVNLGEFWRLHLRFCLAAQLWESRNDKARLAEAWRGVFEHHKEASKGESIPLGSTLPDPSDPGVIYYRLPFPWELEDQPFDEWVQSATLTTLKENALSLIHGELNLHIHGRRLGWERAWEPSKEKFRPVIWVDSLWSAIWEFFGWDTASISWRRCPHCQRFFYPKRRDQFYCTPRQQALASKRRYAAMQRAEEKKKKQSARPQRVRKRRLER